MATRVPAQLAAQITRQAAGRCEYCHAPQILIGRATVAALDINAKLLQQARPYWRVVGLIP